MSAATLAKMDVYREILFAGFLQQSQRGSFPPAYVRSFFGHYGEVEHFVFDAQRGIGSVKFLRGDAAANCYLAVNLSLLPPPQRQQRRDDEYENGLGNTRDTCGDEVSLIVMEFALTSPCANPCILLAGELSRHLVRHKTRAPWGKVAQTPSRSSVADHIVMTWHEEKKTSLEPGLKQRFVRDGPSFPVMNTALNSGEGDVIAEAVWSLLKPERRPTRDGDCVTVLDLWWEYYQRYIVFKTEPVEKKIKDHYFIFAQKATVVQEIRRLLKVNETGGSYDVEETSTVIERLLRDDVYHSVCNYICMKLRFRNDPSWVSFARDVASFGGAGAKSMQRKKDGVDGSSQKENGDGHDLDYNDGYVDDTEETEEARRALLKLPILQAATNLIENVRCLQRVRKGKTTAGNKSVRVGEGEDTSWMSYPTSLRQENSELYMEVLSTLDSYSPTGGAASLMAMCEDPNTFQSAEGHIGWHELRGRKESTWWVTCQAIMVVIAFLALAGWIMSRVLHWFGITGGALANNISNTTPHGATSRHIGKNIKIRFAAL